MSKNITTVIILILLVGILYRLLLTSNGNFLFNMDNARDMVDVREMVVLGKIRLTGPTSAIEGFYNGPAWYYLLAVPFILSGGDPYASILMEIILWTIGGFFLMKLVSRWGVWLIIPVGSIWIASDYITLATRYAFNPNPVVLLTPLFIYLIFKYLESGKTAFGVFTFLLAGLFFNFEMNAGIFLPIVIISSLILSGKSKLFKTKGFWIGVTVFLITLLPQIIFDLKHNFIMSKSVVNFLLSGDHQALNLFTKLQQISSSFYQVFFPMLLHKQVLIWIFVGLFILFRKELKKDKLSIICLTLILVPFLGYLFLPVNVSPWHLGPEAVAFIILVGFSLRNKITGLLLGPLIIFFSIQNVLFVFTGEIGKPSGDASILKNEIAAIDYVYQYAKGENFKVYTYLPSVYDYPYQYLFWWYGNKKYGYIPGEYAYAPNKPSYIPSQDKFQGGKDGFSSLVFLIKEPDRNDTRSGWEGEFVRLKSVEKRMVGPIEIEVKKEL